MKFIPSQYVYLLYEPNSGTADGCGTQGADIQSKVEKLEALNQAMRHHDKLKDDAIAQLSDQVMALSSKTTNICNL